jgi:pyruvate-formate lyase-activating enzyme
MRHGVCWFKTDAQRHISKIWEIVQVLERNGIPVKKITTVKPGYIIYEDEWQIVAEPFTKGTFQPK